MKTSEAAIKLNLGSAGKFSQNIRAGPGGQGLEGSPPDICVLLVYPWTIVESNTWYELPFENKPAMAYKILLHLEGMIVAGTSSIHV